jgi:hypothetical protein
VAGVPQTVRVCFGPGAIRSPGVQTSLGTDGMRDPRSTIAIALAPPARCQVLSCLRHGFGLPVSLLGPRGRKRARTPERSMRLGRDHRIGGVTPVESAPAPQSKPVARASRLVAQIAPLVASGLGPRILAAGPAPVRLYSYYGRLCGRRPSDSSRAIRFRAGLIAPTGPLRRGPPHEGPPMPNEARSSGHAVQDSPRPLNAASYHPASVQQFLEGRTLARGSRGQNVHRAVPAGRRPPERRRPRAGPTRL